MAIFHFSVKVIGRGAGRSAVAAAAYRAGERLHDERLDRAHDFTNKPGVVHSEILLPENAPEEFADRSEEHTSELQSLMRISYAVFCLKKKKTTQTKKATQSI